MKRNPLANTSQFLFLMLLLGSRGILVAQDSSAQNGVTAPATTSTSSSSASTGTSASVGTPPPSTQQLPASVMPIQVDSPSVTLPTPPLPQPTPFSTPVPEATPQLHLQLPPPETSFNPPTAQSLNLPSSQAPGTGFSASTALPNMISSEPGALSDVFGWAKKLRFQAAVRTGYDSNVNSVKTNVVGSVFANLNGGVSYRFGDPRLVVNANLTGGITSYPNAPYNKLQGQLGLGLNVQYRCKPRLVLSLDSSTSYQAQPNAGIVGTGNNANSPSIYTANSVAASYQISDLWTSVSRLNFTINYYLQNAQNNSQGFNNPGVTQSFRYLFKPSTTLVTDINADYYGYGTSNNSSGGISLSGGFDHIFNPKFFWNFRAGAELRNYQNSIRGDGTYIGPYIDSNLSWAFAKTSSLNWTAHVGTQPSGQQNVSYSPAFRTGLNYSQGIFSRLTFTAGLAYVIANYQDNPVGINGTPISYNQSNIQANADLAYKINRIFDVSIGYQYLTCLSPSVPSQEYNRGISYLQVRGGF